MCPKDMTRVAVKRISLVVLLLWPQGEPDVDFVLAAQDRFLSLLDRLEADTSRCKQFLQYPSWLHQISLYNFNL